MSTLIKASNRLVIKLAGHPWRFAVRVGPRTLPENFLVDFEWRDAETQSLSRQIILPMRQAVKKSLLVLAPGHYRLSWGIFSPNWQHCLAWFSDAQYLSVPPLNNSINPNQLKVASYQAYRHYRRHCLQEIPIGIIAAAGKEAASDMIASAQALSLLLSALHHDQSRFYALWHTIQNVMRQMQQDLLPWRVHANGTAEDNGSSTEADQDIAYALWLGYSIWRDPSLLQASRHYLNAIKTYDSTNGRLKPGSTWPNSASCPACLTLGYYPLFAQISQDPWWEALHAGGIAWLQQHQGDRAALFSPENSDAPINFSWETSRIVWRWAHAAMHRATAIPIDLLIAPLAPFFHLQHLK
ncbi:MAG: glycosyl hydrolase family 8, partial [Firmicutes bacterium]|nr:glycosyl hydrolase family 8 [Bacillota bacterium]